MSFPGSPSPPPAGGKGGESPSSGSGSGSGSGYFDYAASAPPFAEALARQQEVAAKLFASPSSTHGAGRRAKEILDAARKDILRLLGFPDATLVLTSGGTEANNLVLRSVLEGRILLAADVHPSAWFAKEAWPKRVEVLPVGADGRLQWTSTKAALVSVLHGNNETGLVHELKEVGVPLHVDAVQSVGHLPLDQLPFTYLTFSAHKFGGPRGVGGVVVRNGALAPQIIGGGQERGARGGTENVAGLAATALALEASLRMMEVETQRLRGLARKLQAELLAKIPGLVANSDPESGLPGLVSVSIPDLAGETVVQEMDLRGFAISAGAACGSGKMEPSRVLLARGLPRNLALGMLRISMGRLTKDVDALGAALAEVVKKQRELAT